MLLQHVAHEPVGLQSRMPLCARGRGKRARESHDSDGKYLSHHWSFPSREFVRRRSDATECPHTHPVPGARKMPSAKPRVTRLLQPVRLDHPSTDLHGPVTGPDRSRAAAAGVRRGRLAPDGLGRGRARPRRSVPRARRARSPQGAREQPSSRRNGGSEEDSGIVGQQRLLRGEVLHPRAENRPSRSGLAERAKVRWAQRSLPHEGLVANPPGAEPMQRAFVGIR